MRYPRLPRLVLFALLAALSAAVLLAAGTYTIVLKDGSTIVAKEKYKVQGNRAIITQLNGTQTFVPADQIDLAKTEAANRGSYGSAVVIPGSPQDVGTPPPPPSNNRTLADLARTSATRDIPTVHRDKGEVVPGKVSKTRAGFLDLSTLPRKPYTHADLTAELQQFFRGQGVDEVEIYEGSQGGDRPLLEITTNSEGSVFKALNTAANALLRVRESFPGKIAAFEILLTTPSRERAGQFVLTPDMATDLVSRKVDVTAFFVKNVQF